MTRVPLLPRRAAETTSLHYGGIHFKITTGHYPDGSPGEVFIDVGGRHITSEQANLARDVAVLISLGLQYGVGLREMREAVLRSEAGNPHTMIGVILDSIGTKPGER